MGDAQRGERDPLPLFPIAPAASGAQGTSMSQTSVEGINPHDGPMTVAGPSGDDQAPYFAVSLLKLSVMSIGTLGIYDFYWFYKNWQLIKQREGTDIMPFGRAFFAVFFGYECFSRIRAHAASLGLPQTILAGPLTAGWIITSLLWRLPEPYWRISMLSFLFMLPVQALANRINATVAPHHDPN